MRIWRTIDTLILFTILAASLPAGGQAETVETADSLDGVTTIIINSGSVDVRLEPAAGVPGFVAQLHGNRELLVSRTGARAELTVEGAIGRALTLRSLREQLTISVREGTAVTVNAGSADITIDGLQRLSVEITTASGDVEVRDGSGLYQVSTSSGYQLFEDVSGSFRLSAGSGDISLSQVQGLERASTSSGDVTATGLRIAGNLNITTQSGDVELEFQNSVSDLRFELISSSGDLRVNDTRAEDTLQTGSGEFLVRASSSSGDQTYRTR